MFLSVLTPSLFLFIRFLPLLTSDDSKANCLITYTLLLRMGSILDLPPSHLLMQLLISFPPLTLLDFHSRCSDTTSHPQTCTYQRAVRISDVSALGQPVQSTCCSWASLIHHILTRGSVMLVYGMLMAVVPMIMNMNSKMNAKLLPSKFSQDSLVGKGSESPLVSDADLLPFETLLNIAAMPGRPLISSLLVRYNSLLSMMSQCVSETFLVSLVCLPNGLYFFFYALFSRVMPKVFNISSITADAWMLGLSNFYVLGRVSYKADLLPSFLATRQRMMSSQAILEDVLPSHIVSLIMMGNNAVGSVTTEAQSDTEEEVDLDLEQELKSDTFSRKTSYQMHDVEEILGATSQPVSKFSDMHHAPTLKIACGSRTRMSLDAYPQQGPPISSNSLPTLRANSEGLPKLSLTRGRLSSTKWGRESSYSNGAATSIRSGGGRRHGDSGVSELSSGSLSPGGSVGTGRLGCHAESHDCVSIFFSDIVGFSSWAHQLPAGQIMDILNELYTRLDGILTTEMPTLYKVETIGDGYMVAGNLTILDQEHAANIVRFALRAQEEAAQVFRPDFEDGSTLQLRIGIHSGPVVTGMVGKIRRRFCLFGDTVNMASRCETSCPPDCIQLTEMAHDLAWAALQNEVAFQDRGPVTVKGSSTPINMYIACPKQTSGASRISGLRV
ncbi:hypothetical protein CEUSTIGMA_g3469.t1 [Chlamydomonas eustigma]|uniref:Guanylate cyclase domain-containing protein n=1 Tax=Chlamydomonas eustigma TaxID=1157962 RepID=A0A250WZ17_9CHLO|nr:hypothetical protein CEUSTIGMA_g3469.t1 [Chlamydomonas eustigma]|eukprot:GAX76026.1 hypothetical protein CEUSTIGMA_g3469.t1 [Chlamydomonas eustigma]